MAHTARNSETGGLSLLLKYAVIRPLNTGGTGLNKMMFSVVVFVYQKLYVLHVSGVHLFL